MIIDTCGISKATLIGRMSTTDMILSVFFIIYSNMRQLFYETGSCLSACHQKMILSCQVHWITQFVYGIYETVHARLVRHSIPIFNGETQKHLWLFLYSPNALKFSWFLQMSLFNLLVSNLWWIHPLLFMCYSSYYVVNLYLFWGIQGIEKIMELMAFWKIKKNSGIFNMDMDLTLNISPVFYRGCFESVVDQQ